MLYERVRTIFTPFVVLGNPFTASTTDAPFTPKRFYSGCQSSSSAISARNLVSQPSQRAEAESPHRHVGWKHDALSRRCEVLFIETVLLPEQRRWRWFMPQVKGEVLTAPR